MQNIKAVISFVKSLNMIHFLLDLDAKYQIHEIFLKFLIVSSDPDAVPGDGGDEHVRNQNRRNSSNQLPALTKLKFNNQTLLSLNKSSFVMFTMCPLNSDPDKLRVSKEPTQDLYYIYNHKCECFRTPILTK